jgi:hypothetical protein
MTATATKNIVLCCDGAPTAGDSNVSAIYRKASREGQVAEFRLGRHPLLHLVLPGLAMRTEMLGAYHDLARMFEPGDRIFLFGAGRGAITAHRLADLLFRCGLPQADQGTHTFERGYDIYVGRQWPRAVEFKEQFGRDCSPHVVGMLDATEPVSRGPVVDRVLSPVVPFAYHAVAFDDRWVLRKPFLWDETRRPRSQVMEQVWFPGAHDDVVGTRLDRRVSDCALKWLLERAQACGLRLAPDWDVDVHPDPDDAPIPKSSRTWWEYLISPPDEPRNPPEGALIHESLLARPRDDSSSLAQIPQRPIIVRWSEARGVEDLKREAQFEQAREEVKTKPNDARAWRRLAAAALSLNRADDYARAVTKALEFEEAGAFTENVGQEIRIAALDVSELEFFGSFRWKLAPRMNVLLGKNGYGKSHLLRLIVTLLQYSRPHIPAFIRERSQSDAQVELQLTKNDQSQVIRLSKVGFEANEVGKVPVLAISELRFVDKSREDFGKEDIGDDADLKVHGADRFLSQRPLGPIFQDFLHRLCIVSGERKTLELPIIDLYQEVVRKLTSSEFRFHRIERLGTSARYKIEVKTEGNDQPVLLQQASQGTLSVMAMVGLIFDFLTSIYGDQEGDVRNRPGLVFIDELDAHLHPSWQRKVLGILRTAFPEVQFIVAAHSPLVVAGCKQGEVAVLRRAPDGPGFRLEQPDRHFLGATTSELYDALFEIEEKDETYLHYAAMFPFRGDLLKEVNELETRRKLSPKDANDYARLASQRRNAAHLQALALSLLAKEKREPREESMLGGILGEAGITAPLSSVDPEAVKRALSLPPADEARLDELERLQKLPRDDEKRLSQLQEDLYYLGEFVRVERQRTDEKALESAKSLALQEQVLDSAVQRSTDA